MNRKFASAAFALICLLASSGFAPGAEAVKQAKPLVFTTVAKPVAAKLQLKDGSVFTVAGRASFTLTAANEDDTLTGTFVYALPEDARHKLAQAAGKNLNDVPSGISVKDVSAAFRRGTACPLLRLEVSLKEAQLGDAKLLFDRLVLDIQEAPEQINQLFCSWTRQINANRQRRGVIAAINRLIKPADED